MGTNAKFLWWNQAVEFNAVITSSGDVTNYPRTNVLVQQRSEVWRSRIIPASGRWGAPDFTGTGLNDLTLGGIYSGSSDEVSYRVQIDGVGTPNTFKWSDTGGVSFNATGVAITGSAQTLNNDITVTLATTGHTLNDRWDWKGGEPWLQFDLLDKRNIWGLGWIFDEFPPSLNAKIRTRVSDNADLSTPALDSTIDIWEPVFALDQRPDSLDSIFVTLDGFPTQTSIPLFPKLNRLHIPSPVVAGRYVRFNFKDSGNTDGFIEIAYTSMGFLRELQDNFSFGGEHGRIEEAGVDEAGGGQLWFDPFFKRFGSSELFQYQESAESLGFWMFFQSHIGTSKEIIVSLQDDSPAFKKWTTYYAHIKNVNRMKNPVSNLHDVQLELEELL